MDVRCFEGQEDTCHKFRREALETMHLHTARISPSLSLVLSRFVLLASNTFSEKWLASKTEKGDILDLDYHVPFLLHHPNHHLPPSPSPNSMVLNTLHSLNFVSGDCLPISSTIRIICILANLVTRCLQLQQRESRSCPRKIIPKIPNRAPPSQHNFHVYLSV